MTKLLPLVLMMGVITPVMGQKIKMALNMKTGDTFQIETNSDQDLKVSVMGMDQNFQQEIGQVQTYEVTNVSGKGEVEFKITYDQVQMKSNNPQAPVEFDSGDNLEASEVPMAAKGMATLPGQSYSIRMSSKGEVLEVNGMDNVLDNMMAAYSDMGSEVVEQMGASMRMQFGDEAVKSQLQQLTGFYDEKKKTKVGKSWKREYSINQGVAVNIETTYKLEELKNNQAVISYKSKITPNPSGAPMLMGGMELSYEMEGKQSGKILMNLSNGWPALMDSDQDVEGIMHISGEMGDMEGDMKIMSVSKVKVVE